MHPKTYRYGYLDKVLSVAEGKERRTFTYHADGQLATATRTGGPRSVAAATGRAASPLAAEAETETFLWDGLALIRRGSTTYVNEPHPGGGAAVASSKDGVMFNDILGTTLGTEGAEGYAPVDMTAFGDASPSRHLFTGKPEVDGLGYAFLFRNYRASLGKWQTADPLGYPDGWNQMAYCGNEVIDAFDLYGCHTWEERRKVEPIVGSSYEVAIKAHCTENYYNLSIDYSLERVLGSASSFVAPFDGTYNGLHVHDSEATYSNFSYTTEDDSQTVDYVGLNAKRVTRTFKLIISYSISFSYQHEVYNPDLGDFETRIEHGVKNMTSEWSIRFQCRHQIE